MYFAANLIGLLNHCLHAFFKIRKLPSKIFFFALLLPSTDSMWAVQLELCMMFCQEPRCGVMFVYGMDGFTHFLVFTTGSQVIVAALVGFELEVLKLQGSN